METTLSDCTELKKYGWEPKIHIEEGLKTIWLINFILQLMQEKTSK
jgi:hypothetical protein